MTFTPGQSGNPAGRAAGSRNKQTLAAEALLFEHAQELVANLVTRAKNGEPAAMRIAMERILPTGRGRPLPVELPPVRSAEDARIAAGVIMEALKQGALSAREAVDLINVVGALTRLTGALEYIKKVARTEVAKSAHTLGLDHFLASRPYLPDFERRAPETDAEEEEADIDDDELPPHQDENWSDMPEAAPEGDESLQIVADSDDEGGRTDDLNGSSALRQMSGSRL
ncbi:MAG: hypothetical protein JO328_13290 [Hyphomicrobiales bacterium]|nr:hypothetical protein [Hyphomicrobiales bacterium]MBV8824337.1 hypothetical protein [Hyphomicrobiales bacterium]